MGEIWKNCTEGTNGVATIACIPSLVGHLVTLALELAGVVAVFFIIWGGFKFIRSGGDPKQIEGARQAITYAILGLIIVLLAYFVIYVVSVFTGVTCIRVFGFNQCTTTNPS